jgi:hypothetical protein
MADGIMKSSPDQAAKSGGFEMDPNGKFLKKHTEPRK